MDLVGGIQAVTLSDEEARRRGTQKTVLERKQLPTFDVVIEIQDKDKLAVHHEVAKTVDRYLRGVVPRPELRTRTEGGDVEISAPATVATPHWAPEGLVPEPPDDQSRPAGGAAHLPVRRRRTRLGVPSVSCRCPHTSPRLWARPISS
jgi:hypothetical protein